MAKSRLAYTAPLSLLWVLGLVLWSAGCSSSASGLQGTTQDSGTFDVFWRSSDGGAGDTAKEVDGGQDLSHDQATSPVDGARDGLSDASTDRGVIAPVDAGGDATLDGSYTATVTVTSTGTVTATATGIETLTVTASQSGTGTNTGTISATETATATQTISVVATSSSTGTATATTTSSQTGTDTGVGTGGGTGTQTTTSTGTTSATSDVLSISPSELSFGNAGFVACRATPVAAAPLSLTLSNTTTQSLNWLGELGRTPSPFTIAPSSGTLTPSGTPAATVVVTVTPSALPFPASTAPNAYGDLLTITTTIPTDIIHTVPLNQTAQGAILAFQPATAQSFGGVAVGSTGSASIQVVNSGNTAATVTLTTTKTAGPADASFTVNSAATAQLAGLAAGASQGVTLGFAPGSSTTDVGAATGTLTAVSSVVLCAALPVPMALSGSGLVGVVTTVPAASITFTGPGMTQAGKAFPPPAAGFTYCGTTAATQTITFGNIGNEAYTVTQTSLGQGSASPYGVSIGNSGDGAGVVVPGKTVLLTLTSAAVPDTWNFQTPAVDYNDVLTVTTSAYDDAPHVFSITQSPYGAVPQSFAPPPHGGTTAFNFPNTAGGGQSAIPMGIANAGNAPATLTFTVTSNGNAPAGTWTFDTATLAAFSSLPDGTTPFSAYFNAPLVAADTAYSGGAATFTVSDTPLCTTTLPVTAATMSGRATLSPPITVTPASVSFNGVSCGPTSPSGMSKTMSIKNTTGAPVSWTASIPANANATTFTLSATSGQIAAATTGTFTIAPAPIPTDASVIAPSAGSEYATTLTVTVGADSFAIPVTEYASGLFVRLPAALTSTDPRASQTYTAKGFLVQNWGDVGATITLTLSNTSAASLSLDTTNVPPGADQITSYLNRIGSGGVAGVTDYAINASTPAVTGTASVATSAPPATPVCWPMPTMPISAVAAD